MPSADVINVNFAALRAAADSLSTQAGKLEANLESLRQSIAPIKATWYASGSSAGQAAEQSETRLRTAIANISSLIAQFSTKTTEAHDVQIALEQRNLNLFA